jgi:hypothetical protein
MARSQNKDDFATTSTAQVIQEEEVYALGS